MTVRNGHADVSETRNPGSPEAREAGCICPEEANHHGVMPPLGPKWWVDVDCPLHQHWLTER